MSAIVDSLPRAILTTALGFAAIPAFLVMGLCIAYLSVVGKAVEWVSK